MFRKANFLFITSFICIFIFIGLFNYIVDPYNIIFTKNKTIHLEDYKKEMIENVLNYSSQTKFEYLVLGSSTMTGFFHKNILSNKTALFLTIPQFDFITQVEYLEIALKIHPEIKTIIFPIEYAFFSINDSDRTPKINYKKLNIKDIAKLLFSKETTIKSLNKILECISNPNLIKEEIKKRGTNIEKQKSSEERFGEVYELSTFPERNYSDCIAKPFHKEKYKSLKKLKEITEHNKDKKVIFIFPPYHALAQSYIYKTNKHEIIQNIKKQIVKNFPNAKIIDFAYINKYTQEPIEQTYNYRDIIHPQGEPGSLFYCSLKHLDDFNKKDIYEILTKENIDKIIAIQNTKLKEYIKNNEKYIDNFIKKGQETKNKKIIKSLSLPESCQYYIDYY